MKKYVFSILFVFCVTLAGCQNQTYFKVWDYTVDSLPDEQTMMSEYFSKVQHNSPLCSFADVNTKVRQIGDTLFCILKDMGTIYVYNTISYQVREIPMKDKIYNGWIESVYYHNHDSIFFFFDQRRVQNPPEFITERGKKLFDIMLMNGQGDIIGTYMVNQPFKQYSRGVENNVLVLTNYGNFCTGLRNDELLINFSPWPDCFSEEYASFNPPIAALYNLKTGNCRMLNIHYPSEYLGKKFGEDDRYIRDFYWIMEGKHNDLFIFFEFIPTIYHYDFQKDTMTKWDCKYDKVFTTTDTANMEYGKMALKYDVPRWCSEEQCYFRQIWIVEYKDYKQGTLITEILDSNFNHLAYAIGKEYNKIPYTIVGSPIVKCSKDQQGHQIHFNRKLKKVKMSDFEKNMVKKPVPLKDSIGVAEYFHRLNIPDKRSVVLIANMKYPCGTCYDFIFSTMQYNRDTFETNNIYCISYDPNGTSLMDSYLEKYGLTDCKNIIKDTTMLGSVYGGFNYCFGNYPYILLQYMDDGKYTLEFPEFQTLHTMWGQLIKNQIEWKRKEE
jgi:hypothetical protein